MAEAEEPKPEEWGKYTAFWMCLGILVVIAIVGTQVPVESSRSAWVVVMIGLAASTVIVGESATGLWQLPENPN